MNSKQIAEEKLFRGVIKLHSKILGLSFGLICGLGLFIATNWLVIKGGRKVGQHLKLLAHYFPGYSVSFTGSLFGFIYGFLVGACSGILIGWLYNTLVRFRNY
jgi:hypothetical protein